MSFTCGGNCKFWSDGSIYNAPPETVLLLSSTCSDLHHIQLICYSSVAIIDLSVVMMIVLREWNRYTIEGAN